ncbi:MAG: arsenite methyltransferase [Anaerolineales bacterium]|jgi:arsenite methyltransferase
MSTKEPIHKEKNVDLPVINSQPEPCCGNSAFEPEVPETGSIHDYVQDYYAQRALNSSSCCGSSSNPDFYDLDLLENFPQDVAGFSLGCGDPITSARLQPGETVLDLGSGGGLDCFLASKQVGESGFVIGVDMTPEMLDRARNAALRMEFDNVEFRQGYLERLPLEDNSVDVIISNCVINLSPDKTRVFAEMLRTLRPGGRISVSDIVTTGELPAGLRSDMQAWGACVAGALDMDDYVAGLEGVGFEKVILFAKDSDGELLDGFPQSIVFSAYITARKPGAA